MQAVYDAWGSASELVNLDEKLERGRLDGTTDDQYVMFNDYVSVRPGCAQNYREQADLNLDGVLFRFYVDDKYVGSSPATGGRIEVESDHSPRPGAMNIHFIHSRDLEKYLN